MADPPSERFEIRRATADDAEGIAAVWRIIAGERIHSAIDRPWTVEEQRVYLGALAAREAVHVAVSASGGVIGLQSLDLWSPYLESMRHVAQLGTFVLPEWRGRGVGSALFQVSRSVALGCDYTKFVIQVRASNGKAQAFYRRLGFTECGRLRRQVRIDGRYDDEILMELFL